MNRQYVIIGTSAAALGAVQRLLMLDPNTSISVISREVEPPYNKCYLADYVSGLKSENDVFTNKNLWADSRVQLYRATEVIGISPDKKNIELNTGLFIFYDALLIATGSSPYIPPITGIQQSERILTFHTLHDIQKLLHSITNLNVKHIAIIGAGLSGLECADALITKNIQVSLIERSDQIFSSILPKKAAECITSAMQHQNVALYTQTMITEIVDQKNNLLLITHQGKAIHADICIIATGLKPNSQLASAAGIACYQESIVVNEYMQTNIPDIYAAGDVIVTNNQFDGSLIKSASWPDAMQQGNYAAYAMAGQPKAYPGIIPVVSSSFFGLKIAIAGCLKWPESTIHEKNNLLAYERYTTDSEGKLKGFIQIAQAINIACARKALLTQQAVSFTDISLKKPLDKAFDKSLILP